MVHVEIETEWNLKVCGKEVERSEMAVEIETEWNLKINLWNGMKIDQNGRDRNRVEFKVEELCDCPAERPVEIETEWNLKDNILATAFTGPVGRDRNRVEFKGKY